MMSLPCPHTLAPVTLSLLLLACPPARAEGERPPAETAAAAQTPTEAAAEAQAVVEAHCAGLTKDQTAAKADALGAIGPVYSRVSALYESTGVGWLQYWRGVLGQCLGQSEAAEVDLYTFVRRSRGDGGLSALVKDAERRLRLLQRTSGRGRSPGRIVGLALGGGFAAGAALSGVGLGVAAQAQAAARDGLYKGGQSADELERLLVEGAFQAQRQSVLLGVTVGLGVTSAVFFIVSAASKGGGPPGTALRVTGGPGDVGFGLAGRW